MRKVEDYRPLLRSVVREFCRHQKTADREELESEGMILIWNILSTWTEDRGEPAGYLRSSLHRRFADYLEEQADQRMASIAGMEPAAREESVPVDVRSLTPREIMYLRCLRENGRRFASRQLGVRIRKQEGG